MLIMKRKIPRKWKSELWNPGHAKESKQADASTYSLTYVDVASVQEPFDSRKWAFIAAGLLVISNQLQHLFSYDKFLFLFFLIGESSDCLSCPFKTLEMNQQDSNHSGCLHSAQEASETCSCSFTVFFFSQNISCVLWPGLTGWKSASSPYQVIKLYHLSYLSTPSISSCCNIKYWTCT